MISRRVPDDPAPNAWAQALSARREAGEELLDLTDADPIRAGLSLEPGGGPHDAAAGAAPPPASAAAPAPDPRGARPAREAVAAYYRDRGARLDPAHVVLTTGTSESYAHLFRLLADPGGRIAAPRPSYPLFEPLARAEGVELVHYRLEAAGGWRLDLDSVESALAAGAHAVLVVQPNHPTGTFLHPAEIEALESRCLAHGAALISDEVFGDYGWPPARRTLPSLLGPRRVPTFVLSGLSKVCGRPDLKLGWIAACGPAPALGPALQGLEWLADLFLSVGAPVQAALPGLLAGRHAFQRRVHERLAGNLGRLTARLAGQPELRLEPGAGGWVIPLRIPERGGEEWLALRLLEQGVVVHPGHFYDYEAGARLVISLLAPAALLETGLDRLIRLLAEP